MPWVYILRGKRYYVGSTPTLINRIKQHRRKHTYTTKRIGDWKLSKAIFCKTLLEARKLEIKIKKSKNAKRWVENNDQIFEL